MKNKKQIIIISIVASLLVFICVVFTILAGRVKTLPLTSVGNTAGNANNGGTFCEFNGTVYFSNPYDNGNLYSMTALESNVKKLAIGEISHINASESYLFYFMKSVSGQGGLGYVRGGYGIYRSSLNGKDATCLSRDLVFNMQLSGNDLYYLSSTENGAEFYRLAIDKSDKELISNDGLNFACALPGGPIYYYGNTTNHYLYAYDTTSETSSVVWEGNLWNPVYDNGYIYYMDVSSDYRLCRYSLTDTIVEVLTNDRVDCFNLAGGYIYYQKNSTTEPALKRMTLTGSEVEIIAEGNYTEIQATSQYVYFRPFETTTPIYRTPVSGALNVTTFEAAREAAINQ